MARPSVTRPDEGKASPSDAELIERCLRKDNAAWEQIVARFRRKVFHIAYKFTGKHDEAEDLTQEIFLKVFKSLDKFNRDADFSTWLCSVARNYCIDHYRASKRERRCWWRTWWPSTWRRPPRATRIAPSRTATAAASCGAAWTRCPRSCGRPWCCATCRGSATRRWRTGCGLPEGTVKSRINRGREELSRLLLRAQQPAPARGGRAPGGLHARR